MKEIDWSNLSFGYMKTDYNVRINFREGEWGKQMCIRDRIRRWEDSSISVVTAATSVR